MDASDVAKAWIGRALNDLFFSFEITEERDRLYKVFFLAMGLEKCCKGLILFNESYRYDGVDEQEAIRNIDSRARELAHNYQDILTRYIGPIIGMKLIASCLTSRFDGHRGVDYLPVLQNVYLDFRYPIPNQTHEIIPFLVNEKSMEVNGYWDLVGCRGMERFVFQICREILSYLKRKTDLSNLRENFALLCGMKTPGNGFIDIFFLGDLGEFI